MPSGWQDGYAVSALTPAWLRQNYLVGVDLGAALMGGVCVLQYKGAGTPATLTITDTALTTTCTGAAGDNLSLNLTTSPANTLGGMIAAIAAHAGPYLAAIVADVDPNMLTQAALAHVTAVDVRTSPVTIRGINSSAGDVAMQTAITAIINDVQSKLGIRFKRQVVKTYPDDGMVEGTDYDLLGEPLMWFPASAGAGHYAIPLPYANVQSIERVRLFYGNPGAHAQNKQLYGVPADWITFTSKEGVLRIGPGLTTMLAQGNLGGFGSLPYPWRGFDSIPAYLAVDYTIGEGQIDADIAHYIGLRAAVGILGMAGAAADMSHGLASESLTQDGQTESITLASGKYGPYSGLVSLYQDELATIDLKAKRTAKKGLKLAVW